MPGWSGMLAMTLMVRDEEDILPAHLDYHLSQGVDQIFAVDHRSEDATGEILAEYARSGHVVVSRDDADGYEQARIVQGQLTAAVEAGADWIIHGDADEFWIPLAGTVRDVFAAVPPRYGYLSVPRCDMRPSDDDRGPFYERIVVRERESRNLRGGELEPKVAHRPEVGGELPPGNHVLIDPVMEPAPDIGAIQIFHFSMRSFEQFERKVIKTGIAYEEMGDNTQGVGVDQLKLLEMQRAGELRSYYEALVVSPQRAAEAGRVVDTRLRDRMTGTPERVEESLWLQDILHRTWARAGELADHRERVHAAALEHEIQTRELALGDASWELEKANSRENDLIETLDTIRSSAIMRYTAPARAVYYGLRRRR